MDYQPEAAFLDAAAKEQPRNAGLKLGGPWPVTIKIILLKLFGLGLLMLAVLSQLGLREHAADGVAVTLNTEADSLGLLLRGTLATPLAPAGDVGGGEGPAAGADEIALLLDEVTKASGSRAAVWGRRGELIAGSAAVRAAPPEPPSAQVAEALGGERSTTQSTDAGGDIVVSLAAPLTDAAGDVVGALTIRSPENAVWDIVRGQERAVYTLFAIGAVVLIINAIVLAIFINRRLVRLAQAAERVRAGASVYEIPEPYPNDTVGELAGSFRAMAISLSKRMAATEAFAADVAHELKNPLTSLRSAVETLPHARSEQSRDSLLRVIAHDVRRIDRLISDISDASRLDRELSRSRFVRLDLRNLLHSVVDTERELGADRCQSVNLAFNGASDSFTLLGNELRLTQVFLNLLDNARSFAPEGGRIEVTATHRGSTIEVFVDDDGPGIDEAVLERIFERFYTDRPGQASFGDHSGLGLSISRQIVTAHGGELTAGNRPRTGRGDGASGGARFTVRLPVK